MDLPVTDLAYSLKPLQNSGSSEMNVDGSTPVTFKWEPAVDEMWFLEKIFFFLLDPGTMSHNVFGALGLTLTNGVDIMVRRDGCDCLLKNLKDNVDLLMAFNTEIKTGGSTTAFLNDEDYFTGAIKLDKPIALKYDSSDNDCVKLIVKDDLTGLLRMRSEILIWKTM